MRLLFDHNIPAPLRRLISGHDTAFTDEWGWNELTNGDLLAAAAEAAGFDVLLTADRNLRYQQNLSGRRIGLVVLSTNHWPTIRDNAPQVLAAVTRSGARTIRRGRTASSHAAAPNATGRQRVAAPDPQPDAGPSCISALRDAHKTVI